ncbi:MAG: hypothetical protein DCE90_15180 [Pseudanabaena sp.]|nr:MAG: hypothetical protein DCE90_15180 [Pseudanabaena sp.]
MAETSERVALQLSLRFVYSAFQANPYFTRLINALEQKSKKAQSLIRKQNEKRVAAQSAATRFLGWYYQNANKLNIKY